MSDRKAPSIRDVAAMAGVSYQTVSRVLNGSGPVAELTRTRVERAIAVLGFRPSVAARALRLRRSQVVGVLVAPSAMFVAMDGLSTLELALRRQGLRMLIAGTQGEDFRAMSRSVEPLLEYGVDALVVAANQRSAADLARDVARRMPVVALQPGLTADDGFSSVGIDFDAGVSAVIDHLSGLGLQRLLLLPGPTHLNTIRARITAWTRECSRRGLRADIADPVPMTPDGGYDWAMRLPLEDLPEAIFAVNDVVALGVIRALQDRGINVPAQVSIVGVDDWPGAAHARPSLSTLAQRFDRLSEIGAELVVEAIAGKPARVEHIRPELLIRESSSPTRPD